LHFMACIFLFMSPGLIFLFEKIQISFLKYFSESFPKHSI
jgi:hypothetical protein